MEGTNVFEHSVVAWWYGDALKRMFSFWGRFLVYLTDLFSAKSCITTLFYPWKRDLLSYENLSIQQKFQVLILNITSRFVGMVLKIFTLATFSLVFVIGAGFVVAFILLWIFYPVIVAALIYFGFKILSLA